MHMTETNLNIWGELVVPVGVAICFGFALLVWVRDEVRAQREEKNPNRRPQSYP